MIYHVLTRINGAAMMSSLENSGVDVGFCCCKLQVGFTKEGKILALDINIFNNAGNSLDLSGSVLERAMFHSDNVYRIPDMRVRGRVCFSNLSSNTAFRGFGGPQGMLIVENWIDRIASEVGKRPEEIRVRLQSHDLSVS